MMLQKILAPSLVAILLLSVSAPDARAWGAYHAGFTHVGPGGAYHWGRTAAVGPYGGAAWGRAGGYGAYGGAYRGGYGYGARYGGFYGLGGYHYGVYGSGLGGYGVYYNPLLYGAAYDPGVYDYYLP